MKFQTEVDVPKDDFSLTLNDRILVLGSCFAEHVGDVLQRHKFCVEKNPFGVLYNPESIRICLKAIINVHNGKEFPDKYFFRSCDGLWNSWLHSSAFSAQSLQECEKLVEKPLMRAANTLKDTYCLIVTFGTSHYYMLKGSQPLVVSNCHKQAASSFDEAELTTKQIIDSYSQLLPELFRIAPSLRIVFTVSPYRYQKYGFHNDHLSKATLLLAINELCNSFPCRCYYFPAYEIVVDQLRDYRFYAEDMLHPSQQAIAYVMERFADYAFSDATRTALHEIHAVVQALSHTPLHPETDEYRRFLYKTRERIARLRETNPNIDFKEELSKIKEQLN